MIYTAAVASCAIPGIFAPVQLLAKDKNGQIIPIYADERWSDGSVEVDLPMQRLAELFNVNQFIVSQVNPHAPFMSGELEGRSGVVPVLAFMKNSVKDRIFSITSLMHDSIRYLKPLGVAVVPLITQKYEGDCTIVPPMSFKDLVTILTNPNEERVRECVLEGERATWPHFTWLKTALLIEISLDEAIKQLRRILQNSRFKARPDIISRIQSFNPTSSKLDMTQMDLSKELSPTLLKVPTSDALKISYNNTAFSPESSRQ